MSIIEFKITHADKVEGGIISNVDILRCEFDLRPNFEIEEVMKAYKKGLIILKFEWNHDIENDAQKLVVYRGKVEGI